MSTRDDYDTWTVQWYNIKEIVVGASRLSKPYLPCWVDKTTGIESRSNIQPVNSDPMVHTVKRKRILFEPFELTASGRLPESTKSSLAGKFNASKLTY